MRRIRYQVACSLDGYIAGPRGEFDWIVPDPEVDFEVMLVEFDTLLMGRRSYEVVRSTGQSLPGKRVVVVSRTLEPAIVPILLGGGVPFLPSPAVRRRLRLTGRRVYEASGIVSLRYDVMGSGPRADPRIP